MRKDFSQNFDKRSLHADLIIRDSTAKKYLIYTPSQEHEKDFCHILSLELDPNEPLSIQLAKYLLHNKFALQSFRELARKTSVFFSFKDDTPGSERTNICLIIDAAIIDNHPLDQAMAKATFVDIYDLLSKLADGPYLSDTAQLGISQLINEDKNLSPET